MTEHEVTPVAQIKREATKIIARLKKTHAPVLITQHGRSAAVDIETYERLLHRLEVLQRILRGERAVANGRVLTQSQAERRHSRWLKRG